PPLRSRRARRLAGRRARCQESGRRAAATRPSSRFARRCRGAGGGAGRRQRVAPAGAAVYRGEDKGCCAPRRTTMRNELFFTVLGGVLGCSPAGPNEVLTSSSPGEVVHPASSFVDLVPREPARLLRGGTRVDLGAGPVPGFAVPRSPATGYRRDG